MKRKETAMKSLRHQYRLALDFAARDLLLYFWLSVAIFMMMALFSWYVFRENPDLAMQALTKVIDNFQGILDEGEISYPLLLLNNVRAGAIGLALGFIPFLFLPIISIISNSAVIGLVLAFGTEALLRFVVLGEEVDEVELGHVLRGHCMAHESILKLLAEHLLETFADYDRFGMHAPSCQYI